MDEKTKEIVERLYTIAAHLDDDAEARNYVDADMVASLHVAAHLIRSLSERVGELEAEARKSACEILSAEACVEDLKHLLSKREGRG